MGSVASFITMTAVAFVAFRFVSSTEPYEPESRHAAVRPLQYTAVSRYNTADYYGAAARRPQSRIERLLVNYLWAQVWLSLLSPRPTALTTTSTTPAATERTATTTTPTTTLEPETCIEAFQGWLEYKGCCYEAEDSLANYVGAVSTCGDVAQGVVLANKNARSAADREALFVDLLGLDGDIWLDLFEDDNGNVVWFEGFDEGTLIGSLYVPEEGVTFAGVQSTSATSTYSGADPDKLTFRSTLETATLQAQYACEYCPSS